MSDASTERQITLRCQFCETWNRVDAGRATERPKCGKCARPLLLDRPIMLNDETFKRTVEGTSLPVLVDFYADWCGPCRMMAPAVDALASQQQGQALVAKLDTERARTTAGAFGIRGIPTVIVFRGGREVARRSGALPLGDLAAMLA